VKNRDNILHGMREKGIEVQIGTYALHMHPAFAPSDFCRIQGDMTGSQYAFDHCLTLPLYHELTEPDQEIVVDFLKTFL
jgi:perosamine synthetase